MTRPSSGWTASSTSRWRQPRTPITAATRTRRTTSRETGSVWVGFWNYFGTPDTDAFDTWVDEVALDDERIGCDL